MLKVGISVESFRCAGILLLQWQGEKWAYRQHLKFSHYQPVHSARKNPISPKVFNRFSKSFSQLEDDEVGHLGGKFQVRMYFTFAMARWNLCASTTFEILPLSTCTLCQQKSYISKGIQPIFEILASARRFWGWAFARNFSGAQIVYFCNGKVQALRIDNIWNFATFNLYTLPAKIPYLQRYSTNFRNLHLSSKMLTVAIWVERFRCAGFFTFAMAWLKLCASTTFEILPLSTCTLCQQKSYISKGIQPIFEILASARRFWGWAFARNFSGAQIVYFCNGKVQALRIDNIWNFATFNLYTLPAKIPYLQRYSTNFRNLHLSSKMLTVAIWVERFRCAGFFTFAMAWLKLCASTTFEILPLSTCTLFQQKSYISKGIQPIFEIFASARKCWRWPFGWKVSGAQVFYFCNGKVKILAIENNWNFATFNLYTVQA